MIIIKDYLLIQKDNSDYYVRSREERVCPYCQGRFTVIGSRRRVIYREDGSKERLIIRRLRCMECKRISHELPDLVIPYKRYDAEVILHALDETKKDICCPAEESTIYRWRLWFFLFHDYIMTLVSRFADIVITKKESGISDHIKQLLPERAVP